MIIIIVIVIVIMIIIMTTTIMMIMVANIPTRRSQTDPRCLQTVFSGSIFRTREVRGDLGGGSGRG